MGRNSGFINLKLNLTHKSVQRVKGSRCFLKPMHVVESAKTESTNLMSGNQDLTNSNDVLLLGIMSCTLSFRCLAVGSGFV